MISGHCDANGINIYYLRTGGPKPPMVLLHGLTGNGACWTPVARVLADDYDIIMPDARGHGKTSAPLQGYQYSDYADDAVALIGALRLEAPVLLGHSMGGMTAALTASRHGTAISAVILADPSFLNPAYQREVYESDVAGQHRQAMAGGRDEVLAQARLRHPHRPPELVEILTDARLQTHMNAFGVLTPPNPDYRTVVSAIRVPVLLVIADRGVVSSETAEELQKLNPLLRYECMPNVGHGLVFDQPGSFARIVGSFLQTAGHGK